MSVETVLVFPVQSLLLKRVTATSADEKVMYEAPPGAITIQSVPLSELSTVEPASQCRWICATPGCAEQSALHSTPSFTPSSHTSPSSTTPLPQLLHLA